MDALICSNPHIADSNAAAGSLRLDRTVLVQGGGVPPKKLCPPPPPQQQHAACISPWHTSEDSADSADSVYESESDESLSSAGGTSVLKKAEGGG